MNPILAEVCRNGVVESVHRGSAIVVNDQGEIVFELGETDRLIYPRSSLKFFQAIPLVESGAADAFSLSDDEIALACASHNAEAFHVEGVVNWLTRLGLDKDDLECGPDAPLSIRAAHELVANHQPFNRSHQNCSGKHTGMLTLAKYLGASTEGYSEYHHPTQRAWMQTLSEVAEIDVTSLNWEQDGCGIPAICMPMERLAYGFAQFANFERFSPSRRDAMARILNAVIRHPEMIAGTDRCCTAVIRETRGRVVVKTGAEAVYGGVIPDLKLGFALKVDDGGTRGSEVALGALLQAIGAVDASDMHSLSDYFTPTIRNSRNHVTGLIRPATVWSNQA